MGSSPAPPVQPSPVQQCVLLQPASCKQKAGVIIHGVTSMSSLQLFINWLLRVGRSPSQCCAPAGERPIARLWTRPCRSDTRGDADCGGSTMGLAGSKASFPYRVPQGLALYQRAMNDLFVALGSLGQLSGEQEAAADFCWLMNQKSRGADGALQKPNPP